jgi:hypothetical protein
MTGIALPAVVLSRYWLPAEHCFLAEEIRNRVDDLGG